MDNKEEHATYAYLAQRRRRVRKYEGESWAPDTSLVETRDTGLYCKECRKRIKWKELFCIYEKQGTDLVRMWECSYCGNVIQTDNLTDMQLAREEEWLEMPTEAAGTRVWREPK